MRESSTRFHGKRATAKKKGPKKPGHMEGQRKGENFQSKKRKDNEKRRKLGGVKTTNFPYKKVEICWGGK